MSARTRTGKAVVWAAVWLLLVVVSTAAFGAAPETGEAQETQTPTLHIAVIGASVSAGFASGVTLADVLKAAVDEPMTVTDLSDVTFFLDPMAHGKEAVESLTQSPPMTGVAQTPGGPQEVIITLEKDRPTVVIGIDFLFWFAYGEKGPDARKADLQKGFKFLEQLDCPILVGDLPAFAAGFMIGAEQIPSADELEALNAMIVEWAKKHKNVTVYPLAALVESIRAGQPVTINGEERTLKASEVFAVDKLHTTKQGLITVTVMVLETLSQEGAPLAGKTLTLDPDRLAEKLKPEEAAVPAEKEEQPRRSRRARRRPAPSPSRPSSATPCRRPASPKPPTSTSSKNSPTRRCSRACGDTLELRTGGVVEQHTPPTVTDRTLRTLSPGSGSLSTSTLERCTPHREVSQPDPGVPASWAGEGRQCRGTR
jgi:hypothetical protein